MFTRAEIFDSAKKVGLPDKKVQRVIDKQKFKMSDSDNVVLNSSVEIPNNVSADAQSSFILLPFINKKLASKSKTFFHQLNFKVSFSTSKSLYTSLRPREPAIKGKYGVPNVAYKYHCSACDKRYLRVHYTSN